MLMLSRHLPLGLSAVIDRLQADSEAA